MTYSELADDIIRTVQGGISTVDSKLNNQEYLFDLITQYRAIAIKQNFTKSRRIHPSWTQQFYPEYSKDLQENACFVKFSVPLPIPMEDRQDGFMYIGQKVGNKAYKRLTSRAEIATYDQHRTTKNGVRVLYSDGFLEVYGNTMIQDLRLDGVFADPRQVPTFNVGYDDIPIDDESIILLKQLLIQSQMLSEAQAPADIKQDNKDLTEVTK